MQSRWPKVLLVVLVAALVAVVVISLVSGDDEVTLRAGEAQLVSVSELESFAEDAGHPVYWVGERDDTEYELTETDGGRIYVRYLPAGTPVGAKTEYLTVGSYPVEDAAAALEKSAREDDAKELARSDGGAVVLIDTDAGGNVHVAYEGDDTQIEIFSPVPREALRLAKGDQAQPVS
jgi:hypothetical protein